MPTNPKWKGLLPILLVILVGGGIYYWYEMNYCPSSGVTEIAALMDELQQAQAIYSLTGDKATYSAKVKELLPALDNHPYGCWSKYQAQQQGETECPAWAQKRVIEIMEQSRQYGIGMANSPILDIGAAMKVSQQFSQELGQLPKACLGRVQPPPGRTACPQEWSTYSQCLENNKRVIVKQGQHIGPFEPELVANCIRPVCPEY